MFHLTMNISLQHCKKQELFTKLVDIKEQTVGLVDLVEMYLFIALSIYLNSFYPQGRSLTSL